MKPTAKTHTSYLVYTLATGLVVGLKEASHTDYSDSVPGSVVQVLEALTVLFQTVIGWVAQADSSPFEVALVQWVPEAASAMVETLLGN